MGRDKLPVWGYYNIVTDANKKETAVCKYCKKSFAFPNGTRMKTHLLRQCLKCPDSTKQALEKSSGTGDVDDPSEPSVSAGTSGSGNNATGTEEPKIKIPRTKPCTMPSYFDQISATEVQKIDAAFAKAVYAGGLPFSVFSSNPYFADALKLLRPSYPGPPTTHALREPLLKNQVEEVEKAQNEKIEQALCLSIMLDGWTNRKGDGIVNFVLGTPEIIFYDAVEPGESKEDADYLFKEIDKVIQEVGSERVQIITADNAAAMQAALRRIKIKYPHILIAGCAGHGLNLLAKIFIKLDFFATIKSNAVQVVKIRLKRVTNAIFKRAQKEKIGSQALSLKSPNPTRFSGDCILFKSVSSNKKALEETALNEKANMSEATRRMLLGTAFWNEVSQAEKLLEPIAKAIQVLESQTATLSLVPRVFMDIKQCTLMFLAESSLTEAIKNSILRCLEYRIKFVCKTVHKAAYLLDPRFKGEGLNDGEILDAMEVIQKIADHLNINKNEVYRNITEFRSNTGIFSREILWESAGSSQCDPVLWWQGLCRDQPLRPIAERLLQLPPTACDCERVWSDFEQTGSEKRNRLKIPKLKT